MTANIDNVALARNDAVTAARLLENLLNIRRMEGIIEYYRLHGGTSGEIAHAIAEFVKRGEEGLGMEE